MKAAVVGKARLKRGRSYAPGKDVPIIAVREESRSYPEATTRFIEQLGDLRNHQTALPRIARDAKVTASIEKAVHELPTAHDLYQHDARDLSMIKAESVHLVVTSPRQPRSKRFPVLTPCR